MCSVDKKIHKVIFVKVISYFEKVQADSLKLRFKISHYEDG